MYKLDLFKACDWIRRRPGLVLTPDKQSYFSIPGDWGAYGLWVMYIKDEAKANEYSIIRPQLSTTYALQKYQK